MMALRTNRNHLSSARCILLVTLLATVGAAQAEAPKLEVDRTYRCEEKDLPGSVLVWVGKIDVVPVGGRDARIISASLIAESDESLPRVGHAPFDESTFATCVAVQGKFPAAANAAFDEGYDTWRAAFDKNEAGVWTLTPAAAYWTMLGVLNQ